MLNLQDRIPDSEIDRRGRHILPVLLLSLGIGFVAFWVLYQQFAARHPRGERGAPPTVRAETSLFGRKPQGAYGVAYAGS